MMKSNIVITTTFEVSGHFDQSLLDHLGEETEAGYRNIISEGRLTPDDQPYNETQLTLAKISVEKQE